MKIIPSTAWKSKIQSQKILCKPYISFVIYASILTRQLLEDSTLLPRKKPQTGVVIVSIKTRKPGTLELVLSVQQILFNQCTGTKC
jgi:hypothetical protein